MATAHTRRLADRILEAKEPNICASSNTFTKELEEDNKKNEHSSSSSYLLADDHSQFSRDIEHWMNGSQLPSPSSPRSSSPTETTGVQGSRVPMVQRSVLARSFTLENTGIWYLLAMVLPLFSINSCPHWRCTPSLVLNSAELLMTTCSRVCGRVRAHLRQLSQDQVAREMFATAMDVVLVIYAIGFLILSMYQASTFV